MAAIVAAAAAAGFLASVEAAFTPNVFFNYTIYPHDPVLKFLPDELLGSPDMPPFAPLWNLSFENTNGTSYGLLGKGASHMSATGNSSNPNNTDVPIVSFLDSVFSDVYLAGNVKEGMTSKIAATVDFELTSDFEVFSDQPGWIAHAKAPYGGHAAAFGLTAGAWRIDSVILTMGVQTLTASWEDVFNTTVPFAISRMGIYSLNDFFMYSGQWVVGDTIGGVGGQKTQHYPHVTAEIGTSVTFQPPPHTAMFVLKGLVQPAGGSIMIQWNPDPPYPTPQLVNTTGPYVVDSTLAVTTLDPAVNYTVKISQGERNTATALHEVIFYSGLDANGTVSEPIPENKSNAAAIGGGVGGAVGGLSLVALFGFLFWKKRRRASDSQFDMEAIEVKPYVDQRLATVQNPEPSTVEVGYADGALAAVPSGSAPVPVVQVTEVPEDKQHLTPDVSPSVSSPVANTPPLAVQYKQIYAPPPSPSFTQESDAGAVPAEELERIPPSYNPEWSPVDDTADGVQSASSHHRPLPPTPGGN